MKTEFEILSRKLESFGINNFEASVRVENRWLAFAHGKKFYFIRFKEVSDITGLPELRDAAETGEKAEELVKSSRTWNSLMTATRGPCREDGLAGVRKIWAQEKASGEWKKAAERMEAKAREKAAQA